MIYDKKGRKILKKHEVSTLIEILKNSYPDAKCSLNFTTPFELVIAVMLSAQCTDDRVNIVTPKLFNKCKTIEDYANIDIVELENIIHSCGFYKNKAKNINLCAKQVLENFNGIVPDSIEELTTLAGIGRKSANVILLEVFGIANGIAVDTHCKRISNRIGLSVQKDPYKIEMDLISQIDKRYLKDVNHLFIWHGRYTCTAKNPKCEECKIKKYCNFFCKNS